MCPLPLASRITLTTSGFFSSQVTESPGHYKSQESMSSVTGKAQEKLWVFSGLGIAEH